ncbi:MipA/OmpV family protein (plasmid) [Rhizobium sp. RCAM05350]|nr:MipA/OmpV family protein [Rhizobium sp. RCAM05350]
MTIDPSGIGLKVYERGPFQLDVKAGYDLGRSEDDSDDLHGLGDIDAAATIGGKASLDYGPATFFVSIDKMIGGSDGLVGKAGVEFTQPVTETIILGAGASKRRLPTGITWRPISASMQVRRPALATGPTRLAPA